MSHHFDRPTAIEDGRLNLCDLYVFPETPAGRDDIPALADMLAPREHTAQPPHG